MTYKEDDNVTVEVNCIQNLLELGTLSRFSQPSLKLQCRLSAQTLPAVPSSIQSNSKQPVSQDGNIKTLLENNEFDVAISSSGLKRLLDNTDTKAKWSIPVKIENIEIEKEGKIIIKKLY
ncbi:hypothetical protein HHI36_007699 [Cryptolaemus montrouzieri]|uniref:Uncharacterized protein n=1 Tax=Cryptolaemus montrouzieri TaxID=559131 RepID=A0ABD2MQ96_9CUCU